MPNIHLRGENEFESEQKALGLYLNESESEPQAAGGALNESESEPQAAGGALNESEQTNRDQPRLGSWELGGRVHCLYTDHVLLDGGEEEGPHFHLSSLPQRSPLSYRSSSTTRS